MKESLTYQVKKAHEKSLCEQDYLKTFIFEIDSIITADTDRNYIRFGTVRKDILYISEISKTNHYVTSKYLDLIVKYVCGIIERYNRELKESSSNKIKNLFSD